MGERVNFDHMSERLHIVVPDGTIEKLDTKAEKMGRSRSNLARKIIVDGLKECDHLWITNQIKGTSMLETVCSICGIKPNPVK